MPQPRTAIVIGASGGIGSAWVSHLRGLGATVHPLSRRDDGVDVTDESTLQAAASRLRSEGVRPDWILDATGVLAVDGHDPERTFRRLDPEVMARAFAVNAIGPALIVKHFGRLLPRDRPSAFVSLSARLASIGDNGLGGWMSYRASKAALNQLWRCAAIELNRTRPEAVVAVLHPGTIETDLTRDYARGRYTHTAEEAAADLTAVVAALGPEDSGGFFDYAGDRIRW